jgi:riboflavin synthase alpha subunit
MIIPHTFKNTDIQSYKTNQILNLEVDMLARYAHFSNLGK